MNFEPLTPGLAIGFAWLAWVVSWLAAAAWTRATIRRAGYWREFPGRIVVLLGGLLLFVSLGTSRCFLPVLWNTSAAVGWLLFAGVLAGMAFAWWARLHLGALWSGTVTRKQDHRIVDTGPYGIVRHPIYSGILFSMWMTALERGRVEPLAGAALLSLGLWMQARLEEQFLAQELGAAEYASYSARVPMLAPWPKGRNA
ncbi:MAG: isoprenylcysteine carboxylmethyltransferase family protein [Hyphomonadaceae bacterium]